MSLRLNPLAVPLLAGAIVMVGIIFLAWPRRDSTRVRALILFAISNLIYGVGYAFELSSPTLDEVLTWAKIEYFGTGPIPLYIIAMALTYLRPSRRHHHLPFLILAIIPASIVLLAWTNEQHGLIWTNARLKPVGEFFILDFDPGPWYFVGVAYLWGGLVAAGLILLHVYRRASGVNRKQVGFLLLGLIFPAIANAIYLSGVMPFKLDLSPYALILTDIALAWGVLNYRLLDLLPVAHEAVLASMSDALIVLDTRQTVVDFNAAAQPLVGRSRDAVIGEPASAVFPDWFGSVSFSGTESASTEITVQRAGELHAYDLRTSPLRSRPGMPEGHMIVMRDITDRFRAERELREANRRLEILREADVELSSKLDVQYAGDRTLNVAARLSRAEAAFLAFKEEGGLRLAFGLGDCPPDLIGRLLSPEVGLVGRVIRTLEPLRMLDVSQAPDYYALVPGTRAQITVPLLSGRKLIGVINLETSHPGDFTPEVFETIQLLAVRAAIAIDNSYMYEEREKLVNELDAYSHTVAHDLKGPVGLIESYADLLLSDLSLFSQEELITSLTNMRNGAAKARGIIQSLLLLAGVRLQEAVTLAPVAMGPVVNEALQRLAVQRLELQAEMTQPERWPAATGYGPWVEEVWANYIGNALKYGGDPPRIELGYEAQPDGQIRFWVRDNGPGLAPEDQARLFRPFTRLGKTPREGHGLGLSIVQRIVERMHGEVGVESAPGEGSLFYFTLSAAEVQPEEPWPMAARPARSAAGPAAGQEPLTLE